MTNIEEIISHYGDGCSEKNDTSLSGLDLASVGNNSGTDIYDGLFRWRTINIPQGAAVLSATFRPYLLAESANPFAGEIYGIDEDDTVIWASDDRASQRSKTTAVVSADAADWNDYAAGNFISIDVTDIIQEIVNRTGWVEGNDLALVLISDHNVGNNDLIYIPFMMVGGPIDPLVRSPQLYISYAISPYADWTPVLASIIR